MNNCSGSMMTMSRIQKMDESVPVASPTYDMPNLVNYSPAPAQPMAAAQPIPAPQIGSNIGNLAPEITPSQDINGIPGTKVYPTPPTFPIPANPILPPGYQEVLDYEDLQYMNGFLRTQIGKTAQVDFLIGSNRMVTQTGRLVGVGLNYILLQEYDTDSILTCDFYNIKFVRFFS